MRRKNADFRKTMLDGLAWDKTARKHLSSHSWLTLRLMSYGGCCAGRQTATLGNEKKGIRPSGTLLLWCVMETHHHIHRVLYHSPLTGTTGDVRRSAGQAWAGAGEEQCGKGSFGEEFISPKPPTNSPFLPTRAPVSQSPPQSAAIFSIQPTLFPPAVLRYTDRERNAAAMPITAEQQRRSAPPGLWMI